MDSLLLRELNSAVFLYLTLLFHFGFVSNQVDFYVFGGVLLDFLEPLGQIGESLIPGNIVSQEYAMGTPVEYPCY